MKFDSINSKISNFIDYYSKKTWNIIEKIKSDFRFSDAFIMYIKRIIEKEILKASKEYPVVMVYGQRPITLRYQIHEFWFIY